MAFTQHCIQSNVTHLIHVERVKSVLCIKWPLALPKYAVRAHNFFTHNFLNIQQIFNRKLLCLLTPLTCFNIYSIGWYGWKGLSLSFSNFLQIENPLNIKKVMSKTVKASFDPFNIIFTHICIALILCSDTCPLMYIQQIR